MQTIADWLTANPQAKVQKTEVFGGAYDEVDKLPLRDPRSVIRFVEALSVRAAEHGAPRDVQDDFEKLITIVKDGVADIEDRGAYIQKTLASLADLDDPKDVKLVLRGALPHAPSPKDAEYIMRIDDSFKPIQPAGIASGGSWIWCAIGCLLCEVACLACCTIML